MFWVPGFTSSASSPGLASEIPDEPPETMVFTLVFVRFKVCHLGVSVGVSGAGGAVLSRGFVARAHPACLRPSVWVVYS